MVANPSCFCNEISAACCSKNVFEGRTYPPNKVAFWDAQECKVLECAWWLAKKLEENTW